MATQSSAYGVPQPAASERPARVAGVKDRTLSPALVLLGRFLFVAVFLLAAPMHFTHQDIAYAAAAGVPAASFLVPASGLLALVGALSVLLGYRARQGAWLLVLFLVPVTLAMHNFWAEKNPVMAQMQLAMFFKNVSILGGALLISQFGPGPMSLDAREAARRAH
jgi:putative oxidoreductase